MTGKDVVWVLVICGILSYFNGDSCMIAPINRIVNHRAYTVETVLWNLRYEGYIADYDLAEKKYTPIRSEEEIRERWQQMIDDDAMEIATMSPDQWRGKRR